ncbi:Mannosyl-oligosaccharide glucosidase GCS1 [Gryllus bimaculatus]|nr:Mannosyl-oligosaccharide glucosidase GCS1 [Gryllus bimaculatus]
MRTVLNTWLSHWVVYVDNLSLFYLVSVVISFLAVFASWWFHKKDTRVLSDDVIKEREACDTDEQDLLKEEDSLEDVSLLRQFRKVRQNAIEQKILSTFTSEQLEEERKKLESTVTLRTEVQGRDKTKLTANSKLSIIVNFIIMARQRKPLSVDHSHHKYAKKITHHTEKKNNKVSYWRRGVMIICLAFAGCIGYMGYLETRVNTPFDDQKMVVKTGLAAPDVYWGSYRPGVYFGLKTRDPYSLVSGLMWYFTRHIGADGGGIRHWCEQGDNLDRYGWIEHNGKNFGIQEIQDGPFLITTSFDQRLEGEQISFLVYTAVEEKSKGWIKPERVGSHMITGVRGETEGLGPFSIKMFSNVGKVLHESYLSTSAMGLHLLKETVINSLRLATDKQTGKKWISLPGELNSRGPDGKTIEPNFIVTQVTGSVPFEIDVVFESSSVLDRREILRGDVYSKELQKWRDEFHHSFEEKFQLQSKGYSEKEIKFAAAAFSNLLGGIGYFYGSSRVESSHTRGPVPYWKAALYTAVPSRSFFPRGFLWDEGFHGLLISSWDIDMELDIICHWFDLMNIEGWIPREQILGQEALSKVPEEFVTQRNTNGNPPTFFITLSFILKKFGHTLHENGRLDTLERLFPRLQAWFDWFNVTQIGDMPGTYRWRGRDGTTNRELNPKTLTSGLDDYPRASHPNLDERHVDLRCWIALAANTLADLAKLLSRNEQKYVNTFQYLSNNNILDDLHWSPLSQSYSDYGLHTDMVELKKPPPSRSHSHHPAQTAEKIRVVLKDPELRFVDSTFGYVSLFPFLLQLLQPDSPKLGKVLEDIRRPGLLWTEYGLRSLAKSSPLYMKWNTEHDPPYWRAPIWINMNYLVVRALKHYSELEGPYQQKSLMLYNDLRKNLVKNIMKEYYRTGYLWEQYNDKTGEGQGSRPFTGWSALVVLLMAEIY